MLQGADGTLVKSQTSHLAPCPVQVHDQVDVTDRSIPSSHACKKCGSAAKAAKMLLCDACNAGWHIFCLEPPLTSVPAGDWYCPDCSRKRAALTAAERLSRNRSLQSHSTDLEVPRHWTCDLSDILHRLAVLEGLYLPKSHCEQIGSMCREQHSGSAQGSETDDHQQHVMRDFIRVTGGKVNAAAVHVTTQACMLVEWLREIVQSSLLPEAEEASKAQLWIVDVPNTGLVMSFAMVVNAATKCPLKLALRCGPDVATGFHRYGPVWVPLLQKWALQGRLRCYGVQSEAWMLVATSCFELENDMACI